MCFPFCVFREQKLCADAHGICERRPHSMLNLADSGTEICHTSVHTNTKKENDNLSRYIYAKKDYREDRITEGRNIYQDEPNGGL